MPTIKSYQLKENERIHKTQYYKYPSLTCYPSTLNGLKVA